MPAIVPPVPQVADVMEQRRNDAVAKQLCRQHRRAVAPAALIAGHQPRHRQRDVEHVLQVVVFGVAGVEVGVRAVVHLHGVAEGDLDRLTRGCRVAIAIQAQDLGLDRVGVGGLDLVRDVVIVAAHAAQACAMPRAPDGTVRRLGVV